ncbi:hypothetical protein C0995_006816 [Termitomyces sp. Mi166|nr:hypothetical protein C0995_006816 [Termitomyces sp. Mi166\
MKFPLLTALAAGAALTQVSATPIRVVVVTSEVHTSTNPSFRFGHAMAPSSNAPKISMAVPPKIQIKGGCRGSRFRQKSIEFSNTIRKFLGIPLIAETRPVPLPARLEPPHIKEGHLRILPLVGTNPFVDLKQDRDGDKNLYIAHPHPHHKVHHAGFRQRLANQPFIHRLHIALATLGPWEGRAVAFVLGCGIGVLLRMIWVLGVVVYRVLRGPSREEETDSYTEILFVEEIADPVNVGARIDAPPVYTYPDEKAAKDNVQQNE